MGLKCCYKTEGFCYIYKTNIPRYLLFRLREVRYRSTTSGRTWTWNERVKKMITLDDSCRYSSVVVMTVVIVTLYIEPPLLQQTTSELWCLSGGKRGDYQNCSVLYYVLKLRTVISIHLDEQFLQFSGLGFVSLGPISLCVDLFVFVCICVFWFTQSHCIVVVSLWARWGGPDGIKA